MSTIAALIIVGPLIIGVALTLGFILFGRRKTKEVSPPARTEFDCTAYLDRIFDQRLIDAGIETTLSKCADEGCQTCHPKPEAKQRQEYTSKHKTPRVKAVTVGGRRYHIPRPSRVPDNAYSSIDYDPARMLERIHWKWVDAKTGRTMVHSQYLPDRIDVYASEYSAPVAKIFYPEEELS